MKNRCLTVIIAIFLAIYTLGTAPFIEAQAADSVNDLEAELEEQKIDEKTKEILDALNSGSTGDSAEEFLDDIEEATSKISDLYDKDQFDENTLVGKFMTWITNMVNRVFNILMDFINDSI